MQKVTRDDGLFAGRATFRTLVANFPIFGAQFVHVCVPTGPGGLGAVYTLVCL